MHPLLIVIPVIGAAYAPRLWANAMLRRYDTPDDSFLPAHELARRLLDRNGLQLVRVEVTDMGDHYDPLARAVRINRARFERGSLTAATTCAHEVGHALQHASGYWPFRLHMSLARVARVSAELGTALLLAVPVAAAVGKGPLPPVIVGVAAAGMLGTSVAAQLAALPSELNASFGRALPMLEDCCIAGPQTGDARRILLACSLTYLASASLPMLTLWPWVRGAVPSRVGPSPLAGLRADPGPKPAALAHRGQLIRVAAQRTAAARPRAARRRVSSTLLRAVARPMIRGWLRLSGDY